jgi:oxygen-independent coproporphyrinogen-3 oxidase
MLSACHEHLARAGFSRYETSAYAQPGRQCRHNLNYWTFGDYLGIGAGAHGKLTDAAAASIVRTTQQREPRRYLAMAPRAIARQPIATQDLPFEFMMNALRLTDGFELTVFGERTGLNWDVIRQEFDTYRSRGLVEIDRETCRPTPFGVRFVNEMLVELLPESAISSGKHAMSMG